MNILTTDNKIQLTNMSKRCLHYIEYGFLTVTFENTDSFGIVKLYVVHLTNWIKKKYTKIIPNKML